MTDPYFRSVDSRLIVISILWLYNIQNIYFVTIIIPQTVTIAASRMLVLLVICPRILFPEKRLKILLDSYFKVSVFSMYTETIMRKVEADSELTSFNAVKMHGKEVKEVRYSDNTVLFAQTLEGLRRLLQSVKTHSESSGLY